MCSDAYGYSQPPEVGDRRLRQSGLCDERGTSKVTFEAGAIFQMMTSEEAQDSVDTDDMSLAIRAVRLHELIKVRDHHFRRSVMADSAMAMTLSLFLGELKGIALTQGTLALVNMLDDDEAHTVIESLIHAGLAVVTGANLERRTVGLTPLGSARMRSFVRDYPDF